MKPKKCLSPNKTGIPRPQPVDALLSPRFSGVATFLRLPYIPRAEELDIAIIGIPYDGGATYRSGARFGPRHVRDQSSIIRPWNPALHLNPFEKWRIADFGDLSINPLSIEVTFKRITRQLDEVLKSGARTACVGGDHSILLPILRSVPQTLRSGRLDPVRRTQRHLGRLFWQSALARDAGQQSCGRRTAGDERLAANRPARPGLLER